MSDCPLAVAAGEYAVRVAMGDASAVVAAALAVRDVGSTRCAVATLRHSCRRLRADLRTFRPVLDREHVDELRTALLKVDVQAELVESYDVALRQWSGTGRSGDRARVALWLGRLQAASSLRSLTVDELVVNVSLSDVTRGRIELDIGGAAELDAAAVVPGFLRRLWRQIATSATTAVDDGVDELAVWAEKCTYAARAATTLLGEPAHCLASSCETLWKILTPARNASVAYRMLGARGGVQLEDGVREHLGRYASSQLDEASTRWPGAVALVVAADDATQTPSHARTIEAAGGVVWRRAGHELEILVVHRHNRGDWSLPKGKCRAGETAEACALREVAEETNLTCVLGDELPDVVYRDRNGRTKHVRYWAMETVSGIAGPMGEVDQLVWAPYGDAMGLLTKQRDKEVLASLPSAREVAA